MYNKIFAKILDSSIWLEPDPTRIVWLTIIAAMDQDGFVQFASIANLAHRARVPLDGATAAVATLESPDANSSDPEHGGRRVERIPGGWLVLNAEKYRDIVTSTIARERTRERVRRHREKVKRELNVTVSNAPLRNHNVDVTQSEAYSEARSTTEADQASSKTQLLTVGSSARERVAENNHAKPTNLVNGSDIRRHGQHEWCAHERDGLCIPRFLHLEFVGKSGKSAEDVRAWYSTVLTRYEGKPIGEDALVFWRNEFAQWVGVATVAPKRFETRAESNRKVVAEVSKRIAEGKIQNVRRIGKPQSSRH